MGKLLLVALAGVLASCASNDRPGPAAGLMTSTAQFTGASGAQDFDADYRIQPEDKLSLTVMQVPDLSFNNLVVDRSGNIQLPLIGSVRVAGLTVGESSADIQTRLGARYLRNPQVTVMVTEPARQTVTVDGAVTEPGVYAMAGRTTLMQAVAMAKGPSKIADQRKVAVFRTVEGRRMLAAFDLSAIRDGAAEDPQLRPGDVVVVDTSRLNALLREALQALPGLAIFTYL